MVNEILRRHEIPYAAVSDSSRRHYLYLSVYPTCSYGLSLLALLACSDSFLLRALLLFLAEIHLRATDLTPPHTTRTSRSLYRRIVDEDISFD